MELIALGGLGNQTLRICGCSPTVEIDEILANVTDNDLIYLPIATISFTYTELEAIKSLLKEMKRTALKPVLYIWDERGDDPQAAVVLKIPNPRPRLLGEICEDWHMTVLKDVSQALCKEMFVIGVSNVTREAIRKFVFNYADRRRFVVYISDRSGIRRCMRFELTSFERRPPPYL